jgi:hypothetical protein
MGEWRSSPTNLELGARWKLMVNLTTLPIYPPVKYPPVSTGPETGDWVTIRAELRAVER